MNAMIDSAATSTSRKPRNVAVAPPTSLCAASSTMPQTCGVVKRADSGNEMIQSFCPDCGSPIFGAHVGNPAFYGIRVSTLRQRHLLTPKLQIWCSSELPWVDDTKSLPRVEKHA